MIKLVFSVLCLFALAYAQCPPGSTRLHNGQELTRYCYKYLGKTSSYSIAERICRDQNLKLKDGLNDLQKLYKGYKPQSNFWIGATGYNKNPIKFLFQDKTPIIEVRQITAN